MQGQTRDGKPRDDGLGTALQQEDERTATHSDVDLPVLSCCYMVRRMFTVFHGHIEIATCALDAQRYAPSRRNPVRRACYLHVRDLIH